MAHEARVLIVDDSAAMRALFSEVLDEAKNVSVIGAAASAEEAREAIDELRPNVLTLDVEMPGISGLQFLEEIMEERPMPVVMLSSLTQAGAETSLKALELGAVECFGKPVRATPEEFSKTVGKLGKIVVAAANSNVRKGPRSPAAVGASIHPAADYSANGTILLMSASMGGIDALAEIAARMPATCPPAVLLLQAEPTLVRPALDRTSVSARCEIVAANDGAALTPGTLHVVFDPEYHVAVEAGTPPRLRFLARDPVGGCRPSADLLFGSAARSGVNVAAAILTGLGSDGAQGLKVLKNAGATTFVENPASSTVSEAPAAAIAVEASHTILDLVPLLDKALVHCAS